LSRPKKKEGMLLKMTPFEKYMREVVEQWVQNLLNCEDDYLSMVESNMEDGDGLDTLAGDYIADFVDVEELQGAIEDVVNDLLEELDIKVTVSWKY